MTQRILIVDDDPKITRLLRASLEQAGYRVFIANNGDILRRERPDLVVLDLMLPDRDGWDVTRIVRNDTTLADMPIISPTSSSASGGPTPRAPEALVMPNWAAARVSAWRSRRAWWKHRAGASG